LGKRTKSTENFDDVDEVMVSKVAIRKGS